MDCNVLQVRKAGKSQLPIAHVQIGDYYGDVPADKAVQIGPAQLRVKLQVRNGRIEASGLQVIPK